MVSLLFVGASWLVLSSLVALLAGRVLRGRAEQAEGTDAPPAAPDPFAPDPFAPGHPAEAGGLAALAAVPALRDGRIPFAPAGTELARRRLVRILDERAFTPYYQPIVDLTGDDRIGVEALTRFDDGVNPCARFRHATTLGLGLELELATLHAAIDQADGSAEGFLAVNVSPTLLVRTALLCDVLGTASRPLVIELSEQEAVDDYDELRGAIEDLPAGVQLSVDDAGSGFASLRHILQLRPDYVKLDRTWVHDADHDPARQALIAGVRHFADTFGAVLVAEGIEVPAERDVLVGLGVSYGQGWLLGRPAPGRDRARAPSPAPGDRPAGSRGRWAARSRCAAAPSASSGCRSR
jgi:EAL domain-containing protein (putative c-di-GMP-specific phosphodiesterase class I)